MKYQKPRSINLVTFMLLGAAGLVVYLLLYLWPVYSASSRAKGILYDHVPALYKANLRGPDVSQAMMADIKTSIAKELEKAGINDKAAKIFLYRNPKEIGLEVRFKAKAHFPFPDKTYEFELSPKVVSDATRIDW
jgi:hypothetical protein